MPHSDHQSALVLFSGGQDSSACLAWALERFERVETIGFDYGQRHAIELTLRAGLRAAFSELKPLWAKRLGEDHCLDLKALGAISQTSLTTDIAFKMQEDGLPNTFVPGRNLIFLTFAAAIAPPALVMASTISFILSELADFAVYTPLQRKRLVLAVFLSSFAGLVVDSLVFLWLAFDDFSFLGGQIIGKIWMVLLALPLIALLRRRDERIGLQPV